MAIFGKETVADHFCAETYDGRFGVVIYGHESQPNGRIRRDRSAIGIDLGCVTGGHLAAIVFHTTRPQWEPLIVNADQRYAAPRLTRASR